MGASLGDFRARCVLASHQCGCFFASDNSRFDLTPPIFILFCQLAAPGCGSTRACLLTRLHCLRRTTICLELTINLKSPIGLSSICCVHPSATSIRCIHTVLRTAVMPPPPLTDRAPRQRWTNASIPAPRRNSNGNSHPPCRHRRQRPRRPAYVSARQFLEASRSMLDATAARAPIKLHRRFASSFGIPPRLVAQLWVDMCRRGFLDFLGPRSRKPVHLLWALFFLRKCNMEEDNGSKVDCDEKTFRKWSWFYTKCTADLDSQCVSCSICCCCLRLLPSTVACCFSPPCIDHR